MTYVDLLHKMLKMLVTCSILFRFWKPQWCVPSPSRERRIHITSSGVKFFCVFRKAMNFESVPEMILPSRKVVLVAKIRKCMEKPDLILAA